MPEGDTIFRIARTLELALAGRVVTEFRSVVPRLIAASEREPVVGRSVESVRSAGKHLLIQFSGDLILRSHLRMSGSWHIYRPGERWRRRGSDMRVVVGNPEWIAVGFSLPVVELLDSAHLERGGILEALGPDLLAADLDPAEALARIRERADEEIADVLLDQRVLAGLGNVYKSEVLFVCRTRPFARVAELSNDRIDRIVTVARQQMLANVLDARREREVFPSTQRRTTGRMNPAESLWVYGRKGRPCRACGTTIESARQGKDRRTTYWCPRCQIEPAPGVS